jgi:uncharacterized iron-regulated membrane protein
MAEMTAVEWLNQQIVDRQNGDGNSISWDEILEQAKAMEKEQIIDAINLPSEKRWYNALLYNNSGEQYYNKTYGK